MEDSNNNQLQFCLPLMDRANLVPVPRVLFLNLPHQHRQRPLPQAMALLLLWRRQVTHGYGVWHTGGCLGGCAVLFRSQHRSDDGPASIRHQRPSTAGSGHSGPLGRRSIGKRLVGESRSGCGKGADGGCEVALSSAAVRAEGGPVWGRRAKFILRRLRRFG